MQPLQHLQPGRRLSHPPLGVVQRRQRRALGGARLFDGGREVGQTRLQRLELRRVVAARRLGRLKLRG